MISKRNIFIALTVTLLVLIALGIFALAQFKRFLYPPAPPMPAVVSATMPDILAHLETTLRTKAPHILETLQPGLSTNEISKLETKFNLKLPDDIKQLYQWRNGARPMTTAVEDFFPLYRFVPLDEVLAARVDLTNQMASTTIIQRAASSVLAGHRRSWLCFFDDGSGNGYFYDPERKGEQDAIFYNDMEDAEYIFFPSLKNVLAGVGRCYEKGAFKVKAGEHGPELDEDYQAAEQLWHEFGASRP